MRLEQRLARVPSDESAWMVLAGLHAIEGRDDDALAAFARVATPGPALAQAQALQGEIHLKRRHAERAERALRASIAADPEAVAPRRRLVYLWLLEQRADEARELLWDLYRLTGEIRHLITLVGTTLEGEDSRDPRPELDAFLEQTPDDPWLRRARGLVSAREGRHAEARDDLEFAAQVIEQDPIGQIALAECRLALGALAEREPLTRTEPPAGSPRVAERWWLVAGRIEESRGDRDAAVRDWRQAAGAGSQSREALYALGQALVRAGKPEEAKPFLDRAEDVRARGVALIRALDRCLRNVQDAETLEHLGDLCEASGLEREARAWYSEAIRVDPTRREAQRALARPAPSEPVVLRPHLRSRVPRSGPALASAATKPTAAQPFTFEDIASRAHLDFQYDCGARAALDLPDTMGGGVGLLDYDNDGRLDIYLVNGCRLPLDPSRPAHPNRLYRNQGDGSFKDVTNRAGVSGLGYGMGCAVADYDDDGDVDLFLTGLNATVLYRNRGDGTFEDVTQPSGVASDRWTTAAGFADLDLDGDLDLVAVTYVEIDPRNTPDCRDPLDKPMHCPPGHFPAQVDHLFRNNGDGTFTDVSREAGFDVPAGLGLGLTIVDLDEDGKLDVFVANDAAPDFYFHNLGGLRFEEIGVNSGLGYDGSGRATASMGVIADDLDDDGRVDIFHTNFLNEPNTLHHNLGSGLFIDQTLQAGLEAPSRPVTGFGVQTLDVDNDGRLDLFVANGHVDDRPWAGHPMAQPPHLYRGLGRGRYGLEQTRSATSYLGGRYVGRGAAAGDLDGDGRVDLVVVHRDAPVSVLRNTTEGGHWLACRLVGQKPRDAFGSRVSCRVHDRISTRWLTTGSYLSASETLVRFGLGTADRVDRVEVRWPSGRLESWNNLQAGRIVELHEGTGAAPN